MRFTDFLRTTVYISLASASALAAVTVVGAGDVGDEVVVLVAFGWWVIAGAFGILLGRGAETSPPIATLLATARSQTTLPELSPGRTVLNRLWPLLVLTIGAGSLAFAVPQVPAIATGFAIIFSLSWRRQAAAVAAIEERDGVRFYVMRTSPWRPIMLARTPGFRSNLFELDGASSGRRRARPRA
jgi:hypothetical protein